MSVQSATGHGAVFPLWKAALIGAVIFAMACFLFWATAAAHALPAGSPAMIRSFTPSAGIGRLVAGLLLMALLGASLASIAAGAWYRMRRRKHG